ncbi:MAG: signal recognition particle-docking protein FtsY [Sumerlaeia bacterium]
MSDKTSEQKTREPQKKAGFFGRLFSARKVEAPAEERDATLEMSPEQMAGARRKDEPAAPKAKKPEEKKGFLSKFIEGMEKPVGQEHEVELDVPDEEETTLEELAEPPHAPEPPRKTEGEELIEATEVLPPVEILEEAEEHAREEAGEEPEDEGAWEEDDDLEDEDEEVAEAEEAEDKDFSAFDASVAVLTEKDEEEEPEELRRERSSWFRRLRDRLGRTRQGLIGQLKTIFGGADSLDEDMVEDIEATLIQSDVGVETTQKIIEKMQAGAKAAKKGGQKVDLLEIFKDAVREVLVENSAPFEPEIPTSGPMVVLVVGVNGAGKTTTIAKMAKRCNDAGLSTMLVAGDTFRAAAVEQLEIWSNRIGSDFVRADYGSDAAALAYQAMDRAKARGADIVFIDTAGRLQNKSSLMAELKKIERVLGKQFPGAPHQTLLVLDATTGQNAVSQVKTFSETVRISGLVMTKLDGTAKGGVLLTILDVFRIPICLIGVGEAAEDLRDFDPEQFAAALFGEEEAKAEMAGR